MALSRVPGDVDDPVLKRGKGLDDETCRGFEARGLQFIRSYLDAFAVLGAACNHN